MRKLTILPYLAIFAPAAAIAQAPSVPTGQAPTERPLILVSAAHMTDHPARHDSPDVALITLVNEMLRSSSRFEVMPFSADQPTVKRAIREHTIDARDLNEPIGAPALERVARVVGARYILCVTPVVDASGMNTDTRLEESAPPDSWRVLLDEQIAISNALGRRRLKVTDMAALTADRIASRMSVASRFAARLGLDRRHVIQIGDGKEAKSAPPNRAQDARSAETAAQNPGAGQNPAPGTTGQAGTAQPGAAVAASGGPPSRTTQSVSTDAAANTPPAPAARRIDDETAAARYRESGDIANAIVSLRHAVNDHPADVNLRRQLILAYQQRRLSDAALSEATRVREMAPDSAETQRLYGDCLLERGDAAGARAAYQQAIKLDPNDTAARVALGDALVNDGQYPEGIAAYLDAEKADPHSALPHRRLASVYVRRAAGDARQYAASLQEMARARALLPPTDTETYLADYSVLMKLMGSRVRDLMEELQKNLQQAVQGERTADDLMRSAADMKDRCEAAADYLDKLPAAAGHDETHAHFQQAAAIALQAIAQFRDYLKARDARLESAIRSSAVDTLRELGTGEEKLNG